MLTGNRMRLPLVQVGEKEQLVLVNNRVGRRCKAALLRPHHFIESNRPDFNPTNEIFIPKRTNHQSLYSNQKSCDH